MKTIRVRWAQISCVALGGCALSIFGGGERTRAAEVPPPAKRPDNGYSPLAPADSAFLVQAARTNAAALAIARIAISRALLAPVRALAEEFVVAHEAIERGLLRLAANNAVNLGAVPPDEINRQWLGKENAAFDRDFVVETTRGHRQARSLFGNAARGSKDNEVGAFACDQLAGWEERLRQAEALAKRAK